LSWLEDGTTAESNRAILRLLVATATMWIVGLAPPARAAALQDGTPVCVRLRGAINSETTKKGQRLLFIVTSDIVVGGHVAIAKGTPVEGTVVEARAASWGFFHHHPRLAFAFIRTTAHDGRPIGLRASVRRGRDNWIAVDRGGHLRWAGDDDTFEAYVDGTYEIAESPAAPVVPGNAWHGSDHPTGTGWLERQTGKVGMLAGRSESAE
jgi:hypothetical protein